MVVGLVTNNSKVVLKIDLILYLADLKFEIVNSLDGGIEALTEGRADYFLWEKFTTKPLVDRGVFRRLEDCPTPWPCFVIAARESFIKEERETLDLILEIINAITSEFKAIPDIDQLIADRYNQKISDVKDWLRITEWSQETINKELIHSIQNKLLVLKIIPDIYPYTNLVCE